MINAKKWKKTKEWERLKISSRKLEIPMEQTFCAKMDTIKNKNAMDGPNRNRRY